MTPGESAKDSLRHCTAEEEEAGINLAVTSDHCIYLVQPEKGDIVVLAGSPSEYGYKDATKTEARFSSLKGITCIRNSLFVADHWNNVIRCVNLKTRHVDTVIDFQPCGPIALTVSSAGSVYVLDSEYINVCNILKICSVQSSDQDTDGALGTTMFKMIQESIAQGRRLSMDGPENAEFLNGMSRRGSAQLRLSRRSSGASDDGSETWSGGRRGSAALSRRGSQEFYNPARRGSQEFYASRRGSTEQQGRRGSARRASNEPSWDQQGRRGSANNDHARRASNEQRGSISNLRGTASNLRGSISNLGPQDPSARGERNSQLVSPRGSRFGDKNTKLPHVPSALRTLIPGISLHPALVQMTLRTDQRNSISAGTAYTGSQFRVSVVDSVPEDEDEDEGPEFVSFLNPKMDTPWSQIPIGTLQSVYQEATGQCSVNTPLCIASWDAADVDLSAAAQLRNPRQVLIGAAEWPAIVKVLPPRKAPLQDPGRFRAVAVDVDRVIMADSDSHQIFVVNHTKRAKDRIAGCGKAGYLDGPLDVCRLNRPASIALDPNTHYIYVADSGNHRIRCIDLSTGFMSTVCGNGVKGNRDSNKLRLQSLDSPFDIHFMRPYHLLICCADNSIRRLDLQTSQLETVLVGS